MAKVVVVTLALLVASALAAPAAAADPPSGTPTGLKLSPATTTKVKGQLVLGATLTTADGKPLSGRQVTFYQQVELFGTRLADLGTATTDSTGSAVIAYQPAQRGPQKVVARFAGGDGYARSEASGPIAVAEAVAPFPSEPQPLGPVGHWLPYAIGMLVAGTWLVLLGVLATTARGLRRAVGVPEAIRQPALPSLDGRRRLEVTRSR